MEDIAEHTPCLELEPDNHNAYDWEMTGGLMEDDTLCGLGFKRSQFCYNFTVLSGRGAVHVLSVSLPQIEQSGNPLCLKSSKKKWL